MAHALAANVGQLTHTPSWIVDDLGYEGSGNRAIYPNPELHVSCFQ